MRVLMTGMGGELGTRVALLLEGERRVEELVGMDFDPPRRRLRRAAFHRVDPRDRRRVVRVVEDVRPTAVLHLGIDEPYARSRPRTAAERTSAGTLAVLGAAAETGALQRVVVRSGVEVYGRRRGCVTVPDESVPPDPTSPFGHSLLEVEAVADSAARTAGASVASLRFAPVVGPHLPSPLGRYLRLPVVPLSALADPPFSLLHQEDAAVAVVAALLADGAGPLNVVGPGAVTPMQAVRLGRRVPFPLAGPGWGPARWAAEVSGAPVPDHVLELLRRGRTADGGRVEEVLGVGPRRTTAEVVEALHEWAPVTPLRAVRDVAA
jgi:UDP-glucose 4-epimerase